MSTQYLVKEQSGRGATGQRPERLAKGYGSGCRIYKVTGSLPGREVYSRTDQIRRAAVSVASNIAEGQAHYNQGEFCISPVIRRVHGQSLRRGP